MKMTPEQINVVEGRKQYAETPRQKTGNRTWQIDLSWKEQQWISPVFKFNFAPRTAHIVVDQVTVWCLVGIKITLKLESRASWESKLYNWMSNCSESEQTVAGKYRVAIDDKEV